MASSLKAPANRKESNVWQNEKTGRWHWEVELKRPDGTSFRRGGSRKTEKDARDSRDNAFAEYNSTQGRAGRWTIRNWSAYVQESVWNQELAKTTRDAYAYSLKNHVLPSLGGSRLEGLSVPQLQEWSNRLGESFGLHVANNALTVLSSVLTRAVESGLIPTNPARNVKLRRNNHPEESKMILKPDQQARLLKASKGNCMEMPALLGLRFGLRMGECLGLRWSDVDLRKQELHVSQQAQYVKGEGIQLVDPKTRSGSRVLPIPTSLIPVLKTARDATDSTFVCTKNGHMISAKKASRYFRAVALKAEFGKDDESVPTHHDLRSTFLTHLANEANNGVGVKPHVLMAIAGHSSIATTMKYYIRASDDDLRAAMACVG